MDKAYEHCEAKEKCLLGIPHFTKILWLKSLFLLTLLLIFNSYSANCFEIQSIQKVDLGLSNTASSKLKTIVLFGLAEVWVRVDLVATQCGEYSVDEEKKIKAIIENTISDLVKTLMKETQDKNPIARLVSTDEMFNHMLSSLRKKSANLKENIGCLSESSKNFKDGLECNLAGLGIIIFDTEEKKTKCLF